ncbi:MAG: hypothetical protein AAGC93_27450, partial [Cyanobacteria bacterium P01_F01_bin.53]
SQALHESNLACREEVSYVCTKQKIQVLISTLDVVQDLDRKNGTDEYKEISKIVYKDIIEAHKLLKANTFVQNTYIPGDWDSSRIRQLDQSRDHIVEISRIFEWLRLAEQALSKADIHELNQLLDNSITNVLKFAMNAELSAVYKLQIPQSIEALERLKQREVHRIWILNASRISLGISLLTLLGLAITTLRLQNAQYFNPDSDFFAGLPEEIFAEFIFKIERLKRKNNETSKSVDSDTSEHAQEMILIESFLAQIWRQFPNSDIKHVISESLMIRIWRSLPDQTTKRAVLEEYISLLYTFYIKNQLHSLFLPLPDNDTFGNDKNSPSEVS